MAKLQWKGGAMLSPLPAVMVSCQRDGERPNIVTVAWTGIICTDPPKVYISLRPSRHSYSIIRESGEFVINLTPAALARAADSCGVFTGRKVDKFERFSLHAEPSFTVSAPGIAESPLSLECRVFDELPLGTHNMILADVTAVAVDDSLINKDGRLCLERAGLCAYSHGEYFELGRRIGSFGFSVKKKHTGGAAINNNNKGKNKLKRK